MVQLQYIRYGAVCLDCTVFLFEKFLIAKNVCILQFVLKTVKKYWSFTLIVI